MIYLLALGSPTHPVDPDMLGCVDAAGDHMTGSTTSAAADPLFVHQYSHAWFDFRGKRDRYADYFANSVLATRAHQAFCLRWASLIRTDYWGISASDSQHGYTAWGGPGERGGSAGR